MESEKAKGRWSEIGRVAMGLALAFSFLTKMDAKEAEHWPQERLAERFERWEALDWETRFLDPCTGDWRKSWFLDGLKAEVETTSEGMRLAAGPNPGENASHAVLWTMESFEGDVRIDYQYTRLDERTKHVNIIYIQATGYGEDGYAKDIREWADRREVPAMSMYFNHMDTYHISYAAYGNENDDPSDDYIRARRYTPSEGGGLKGTDLLPDNFRTGFFDTGVPHRITILKVGQTILMRVSNEEKTRHFQWINDRLPPIHEGRIGLRHMWTRSARYMDFSVSERG